MPRDVTLERERRGDLSVYPVAFAAALGVDAFVTDRFGGVSAAPYDSLNLGNHVEDDLLSVVENRRRVARAANVSEAQLLIVRQVHGNHVLESTSVRAASEADALVSDELDVALCVLVADCVPLLVVDASTKRFAVIHAGWRGLLAGVIASTLSYFGDTSSLHTFIGPSISREAYQVGTEVAEHFFDVPEALIPDGYDRYRLDLRLVATSQLVTAGVAESSIEQSRQVTDGGETFFSDRAQRPCGRFALVARRVS